MCVIKGEERGGLRSIFQVTFEIKENCYVEGKKMVLEEKGRKNSEVDTSLVF